jgi:pimeloyl-ACP methyl ester carboxylesterase
MLFFILIPVSIILVIALFTDPAVTALRVLNTGVSLTNSYNITRDIPYGLEPWQKLDIYRAQDADENTPVIVFFLVGHSAGTYIAAMAVTDEGYLQQAGEDMLFIKGVAGIAGPYNFTPKAQEYAFIFSLFIA